MKDTWFRYRDNVESMKSECIKFANKIGVYKDGNESIIVEKIEEIVKNERGLWKETKFNDDEN